MKTLTILAVSTAALLSMACATVKAQTTILPVCTASATPHCVLLQADPSLAADQALSLPSGLTSITGTANQVLANGTSGSAQSGAVTLALPQSIATTSAVSFGSLTTGLGITAGTSVSAATLSSSATIGAAITAASNSPSSIETVGGFNADDAGGTTAAYSVNGTVVIDHSLNATVNNLTISGTCTGCGGSYTGSGPIGVSGTVISCPTCLVTGGGQTITGTDHWQADAFYDNGVGVQFLTGTAGNGWRIFSNATNELAWENSSGVIKMIVQDNGISPNGGSSTTLTAPAVNFQASSTNTPTVVINAATSQTADMLDITTPTQANAFQFLAGGVLNLNTLNGSVNTVGNGGGFVAAATGGGTGALLSPLQLETALGAFNVNSSGALTKLGGKSTTGNLGAVAVVYNPGSFTNANNVGVSAQTMVSAAGDYIFHADIIETSAVVSCSTAPILVIALSYHNGGGNPAPGEPVWDNTHGMILDYEPFNSGFSMPIEFAGMPLKFHHDGTTNVTWGLALINSPSCSSYGSYTIYPTLMQVN